MLAGVVGVVLLSVVITKNVVTVIKFAVMENAVLKVNFAMMACVLIAIQCATLMKNAVTEHALGGNVAIAQMHVHNFKHAQMVFVAILKTV